MYEIEFANQQDLEIDTAALQATAEFVLEQQQVAEAELSVALVDSQTMQELNRRHLDHDYDTDVLSFLLEQSGSAADDQTPRGAGKCIEGEVVISVPMAVKTATDIGHSPLDEIQLYLVHGILHLLGYDDLDAHEKSLMRQHEQALLAARGITVTYDDPPPDEPADRNSQPGDSSRDERQVASEFRSEDAR